ncbi:hypothetical protein [Nonomuraea polychroma]|uniref:hypothetical protein n=1 Tax=Nonomuraea polychroma TaxID=46176 RepID=UPI001F4EF38A|nr:hypothetical protein [Nonomuraea polychroma]
MHPAQLVRPGMGGSCSGDSLSSTPWTCARGFLSCWIRLYGLLCMEVLNQLDFAYTDLEPVFEECLREIAPRLGLDYEAPAS